MNTDETIAKNLLIGNSCKNCRKFYSGSIALSICSKAMRRTESVGALNQELKRYNENYICPDWEKRVKKS